MNLTLQHFASYFENHPDEVLSTEVEITCTNPARKAIIHIWQEEKLLEIQRIKDFYSNEAVNFQDYQNCTVWVMITDEGRNVIKFGKL